MRDLLLLSIVAAYCVVALRQPVTGYLAFVTLGFLNPHSLTWGFGRTMRLSLGLAVCTLVGWVLSREAKRFPRQMEAWLLLALWLLFAFTTYFALEPEKAFSRFADISKVLLMAFLGASLITTAHRFRVLLRVIALSIGFHAVKASLFILETRGHQIVYGPDESFLAANNSIGLAFAVNLPILVYLLKNETRRWLRWIIWAMIIGTFPATIFTYSRGAWLGLGFAACVIMVQSRHRFMIVAGALVVALLGAPMLLDLAPERLVNRYGSLVNYEEDTSAESRFWNWELCGRVGLARPLTGGGFDFYSTAVTATYYPEFLTRWGEKVWSCHSVWLTILGEHGLPGLTLWLALMVSCLYSLHRIRKVARARPDLAWAVDQANMLRTSLMTFMIVGTFLDAAYFDMLYYLVIILVLVKERVERALAAGSVSGASSTSRAPAPHVFTVRRPPERRAEPGPVS